MLPLDEWLENAHLGSCHLSKFGDALYFMVTPAIKDDLLLDSSCLSCLLSLNQTLEVVVIFLL